MMGNHLTFFFSLKCYLIKYPIQFLILLTVTVSFTLAIMIRIVEGPVYEVSTTPGVPNYNDYRDFENCMWNMFVTMTTGKYIK
jgi:hypothetical protein